jgi:polar amino acid transport system permease protein
MDWLLDVYNYRLVADYLPAFAFGVWRTVWISAVSLVAALILGTAIALMRLAPRRWLQWPAAVYVESLRGTPLLVQIYIVYYGIPALPGLGRRLTELEGGILALSVHTAAFMAEIIRAGIESVPRTQTDAAKALGMPRRARLRHVVLPQAFANVVPPALGQTAVLIKDTSLLSIIAVFETMGAGLMVMSERIAPTEGFVTAAVCYLIIYAVMLVVSNHVQRRLAGAPRLEPVA